MIRKLYFVPVIALLFSSVNPVFCQKSNIHIVDVESRHAIIVFRGVVEKLSQRNTGHDFLLEASCSACCISSFRIR